MDLLKSAQTALPADAKWPVRHTIWEILTHWTEENRKEIAKKLSVRIAEVKSLRTKWEGTSKIKF